MYWIATPGKCTIGNQDYSPGRYFFKETCSILICENDGSGAIQT